MQDYMNNVYYILKISLRVKIFSTNGVDNNNNKYLPVVTIEEGQLRGKISTNYRGEKYFSFQGIPYAKPPIGELRFKAPQPPELWSGIRDATREGSPCYQRDVSKQCIGTEDCLFLNVYTPQLMRKPSVPLPVMVWIHGGSFVRGSGNKDVYGPDFLITESVVIVTINYRLGFLGFLSFEDHTLNVPGNAGLKDQVFALKWVQKNINKFYGNPNNVTVFGVSAGAASIHYLMMSPMANGLFHKAIIQSATALNSWTRGQRSAPLISKAMGHDIVDEKAMLNNLKDMPMEEILKIQEKIPYNYEWDNYNPIGPVIENKFSKSPFLIEDPIDLINSGRFNKVPLMIGYNSKDGMYMSLTRKYKFGNTEIDSDSESFVPLLLGFPKGSQKSKIVAKKIKQFYFQQTEHSVDEYYNLQTDGNLLCSLQYIINCQIRTSSSPIYLYRMSLDTNLNYIKKCNNISDPGACHGDEIGYLFKTAQSPPIRIGSAEEENIKKFVKLWTLFANNGDPNPTNNDAIINVIWKPIKKGQLHYLNIGENVTVGINPDSRRMKFWTEIFNLSPELSKL